MSDFDFASVSQQVSEYLKTGDSESGNSSDASPASDSGSAPSGAESSSPHSAQSAQPTKPADEPAIEIDFGDGRVEKLTAKQVRDGYLRQQDYTKKTQELAGQRKQAESVLSAYQQMEQEREQIKELLSNPQALMYLAQQQLADLQGPQFDPNAPASLGQAAQLAEYQSQQLASYLQQMEQAVAERLQQVEQRATQSARDQIETARYMETINGKLASIYEAHPVLQAMPEMEDVIRFRVAQLQPQTIEEALSAFETVSAEVANAVTGKLSTTTKQAAIRKAQLSEGGIEPPGGTAIPNSQPQSYRDPKTNQVDWGKLAASASAYLDSNRK